MTSWTDIPTARSKRRRGDESNAACDDLQRQESAFRRAAALTDGGLPFYGVANGNQMMALFPQQGDAVDLAADYSGDIVPGFVERVAKDLMRGLAPVPSRLHANHPGRSLKRTPALARWFCPGCANFPRKKYGELEHSWKGHVGLCGLSVNAWDPWGRKCGSDLLGGEPAPHGTQLR